MNVTGPRNERPIVAQAPPVAPRGSLARAGESAATNMETLLIGIPLGVLTSLAAWWVVVHGIVPKIEFATKISKLNHDRLYYRLKLMNTGPRDAIDCEVMAEVRFPSLDPHLPKNAWSVSVPVRRERYADIRKGHDRLITFSRYYPDERHETHLPPKPDGYSLDELLRWCDGADLRVIIFAFDAFSGSRRVFMSPCYKAGDIVESRYDLHSLQLLPPTETSGYDGLT